MEIAHRFQLGMPAQQAYELLLDLERVAPCMPGATLKGELPDGGREVEVAVKLGAMRFDYQGKVSIAESHQDLRRAVLEADAREQRGAGTARARITMTVEDDGASASVVESQAVVELTGRAAQSGRGIVEDVARRMVADMAVCLENSYGSEAAASGTAGPPPAESTPIRGLSLIAGVFWGRVTGFFRRLGKRLRGLFRPDDSGTP